MFGPAVPSAYPCHVTRTEYLDEEESSDFVERLSVEMLPFLKRQR
jgi:hypothetical protein